MGLFHVFLGDLVATADDVDTGSDFAVDAETLEVVVLGGSVNTFDFGFGDAGKVVGGELNLKVFVHKFRAGINLGRNVNHGEFKLAVGAGVPVDLETGRGIAFHDDFLVGVDNERIGSVALEA